MDKPELYYLETYDEIGKDFFVQGVTVGTNENGASFSLCSDKDLALRVNREFGEFLVGKHGKFYNMKLMLDI